MHLADGFTRVLVRGDERNLGVRMVQQDAQQFRAAVARPAEDANTQF